MIEIGSIQCRNSGRLSVSVSCVYQVYKNSRFHLMLVTASIFTRAWFYAAFSPPLGVQDPRFEPGLFEPILLIEPHLTWSTARICISGVHLHELSASNQPCSLTRASLRGGAWEEEKSDCCRSRVVQENAVPSDSHAVCAPQKLARAATPTR